jgi:hypothetical protein
MKDETLKAIIFLDDGTTWSEVCGSSICIVKDDDVTMLSDGQIDAEDLKPVFEIHLRDVTPN